MRRQAPAGFLPLLVLLSACAGRAAAQASVPQQQATQSGAASRDMQKQVERLDHLEGLVSRFDLAVTHLEQSQDAWGEREMFDLNDIHSVAEELRLRSSAPGEDTLPELQPRLDAMVERMKGISARYMALQSKIDLLLATERGEERR